VSFRSASDFALVSALMSGISSAWTDLAGATLCFQRPTAAGISADSIDGAQQLPRFAAERAGAIFAHRQRRCEGCMTSSTFAVAKQRLRVARLSVSGVKAIR